MQRKQLLDKKAMQRLELNSMQKRELNDALRQVLRETFDVENPGELQLALLLDALMQPMAKVYYNKGVSDARRYLAERLEDAASIEIGF